ncbi:hypothetical protein [Marinobacterium aestuariivivens]|uniref:Uncharacterized protein n=1 Tax=Marinobacterium aestuariivivens TaxID=1698799 RepID=A0ABW2A8C3_9GAMM
MENSSSDAALTRSGAGAEKHNRSNEEVINRRLKSWVSSHDQDGDEPGFIRSSN